MQIADLIGSGLYVPYEQMSPEIILEVKYRLMDGILALSGGALSARREDCEVICSVARAESKIRPVFPSDMRTSLEMAGFLNAFFLRVADWGDTYRRENGIGWHPSDQIAAVLALCDLPGVSGCLIIELIHLAYQFYAVLQERMFAARPIWDYTTTLSLTIPVLAAVCFGAPPERIQAALNLNAACGAMLGQVRPGVITNMKSGASACAISGGLRSYLLSEAIKAPDSIFEGDLGWYKAIAPLKGGLSTLGADATYAPTEVKAFPCYHVGQAPVECAITLHDIVIAAGGTDEIDRIVVHVSEIDIPYIVRSGQPQFPKNQSEADHHLLYCLAIGLRYGALTPLHYSDAYLGNPEIKRLISISNVLSKRFDKDDPKAQKGACRLVVTLKSGDILQESRLRAEGTFFGLSTAERLTQLGTVLDKKRCMLENSGGFDFSPVSNAVETLEKHEGRVLLDRIQGVIHNPSR